MYHITNALFTKVILFFEKKFAENFFRGRSAIDMEI